MTKRDDDPLEHILSETNEMLQELESMERSSRDSASELGDLSRERARRKFAEQSEHEHLPFDGYAEFTVSADEMTVTGNFYPPGEGMAPLDVNKVAEQLRAKDVVYGVDWELLKETIHRCNTEHTELRDVTIARGVKPQDEVSEHLVLEQLTDTSYSYQTDRAGRLDYRTATPFKLVNEGEVLARDKPRTPGTQGMTVTGRAIPYGSKGVSSLKPGKNTRRENDAIVAAKDGRFNWDQRSFWVSEVLEIAQNVDYSTGHIEFPGDVIIHGEVKDGFKISAGGSVYCATTMDASEVNAEGDLIVKRGLIGRKSGTVRVGGAVSVRFIENCYVEAEGLVSVDTGILHSAIYTRDRIEVGSRGMIVGGQLHCQKGLTATQIGTDSGVPTEIYCGTDYKVEQKLEWVRDKTVALAEKLKEVQQAQKKGTGDPAQLQGLTQKLQDAIRRMNESAQSLVFELDKNEDAAVRVRGTVMPGTYIEICHVSHAVNRSTTGVEFRLDKGSGKIVQHRL